MDNQDLLVTKKLLLSYKERLENEIINRSNKLRIPKKFYETTINQNKDIIQLKEVIAEIDMNSDSSNIIKK